MMNNAGTTSSSFFTVGVAAIWMLATVPLEVEASKICRTDANGFVHCHEKLSPPVIAAIVVTSVLVVLLLIGIAFFFHRTRLAQERAATNASFDVDPSQVQGPPIMIQQPHAAATTYGAPSYPIASAPSGPRQLQLNAVGSAPVPPQLTLNLQSAGASAGMSGGGLRSPNPYGYGPTVPQTAPGNRAMFSSGMGSSSARGDMGRYPFTGISSSQLPPMPPSPYSSGYTSKV